MHVGLAVAVHVGLAAVVLTAWRWTSWAADLVLVLVLVKVAAIVLGHLAIRRRKAAGRVHLVWARRYSGVYSAREGAELDQ